MKTEGEPAIEVLDRFPIHPSRLHPSAFRGGQTPDLPATHRVFATVAPFPAWRGSRRPPLCGARSLISCQKPEARWQFQTPDVISQPAVMSNPDIKQLRSPLSRPIRLSCNIEFQPLSRSLSIGLNIFRKRQSFPFPLHCLFEITFFRISGRQCVEDARLLPIG